jgi:hypothetical protein
MEVNILGFKVYNLNISRPIMLNLMAMNILGFTVYQLSISLTIITVNGLNFQWQDQGLAQDLVPGRIKSPYLFSLIQNFMETKN